MHLTTVEAARLRALLAEPELLEAAVAGDLHVAERLRRRWPAELVAAATAQAELRERAAAKFTGAGRMLFTRAGLEQATSEPVARHRAGRVLAGGPELVLDLCCGIGGDLLALAAAGGGRGGTVLGVDRDEGHALLARHNARRHGIDVAVAVADVRDVSVPRRAAVFVDPARRTTGASRRDTARADGYSPPLDWCMSLAADRVCVKAAPGLDRAAVPGGWEVEFVAVGRELKEAVLWSPPWAAAATRATVLLRGTAGPPDRADDPQAPAGGLLVHSMTADPDVAPAPVRPPGRYLLDPSPAVTRAGAVADLAVTVGGWQLDPRIAFLSADGPLRSPYGTSYVVEASLPFGVKPLAAELRRLDIGRVEIRRRGLAGDATELRRRLRGAGSRTATVVLTRVTDRPWALVCRPDTGPAATVAR